MSAIISMVFGFGCLIVAFMFEGGSILSLLQPSAALIVFGGTFAAIGISFPMSELKLFIKVLNKAFSEKKDRSNEIIEYLKNISINARKNGLLSMDNEISNSKDMDPMIRKGLRMAIDGVQGEDIRQIMEIEAMSISERHKAGIGMFEAAGGFSPTMGIIGTVLSLVNVMANLGGDPSKLGPKIATAFIATLYGVGTANLVWLPIANKLKALNKLEEFENELIIEGIISIQTGSNPTVVVERLVSYLNRDTQKKITGVENKE